MPQLRCLLISLALLALQACSALPGRAPPPSAVAAAPRPELIGARGRLAAPARQRVLAQLAAEGRADLSSRHLALLTQASPLPLYAGNQARLLIDGPATFAAMFAELEQARGTILLETYILEDQALAQRLAELLLRKQAQGVKTHVLYDAWGSVRTADGYFDALRAGGVAVCAFNPVNPLVRPGSWDLTQRDHRKILVVDGVVAFVGGINISEVYASGSFGRRRSGSGERGWRDTQVQLRGPAVAALDAVVREAWSAQGCGSLPSSAPPAPAASGTATGTQVIQIIPSGPDGNEARMYAALLTAVDGAQRSVHLTMGYFAPGADMISALAEAAQRGVDVVLILPSVSDFAPVLHAGRSHYEALLQAGVKLHELQGAVLHAKTAVIDGVFSTVGSSNMDWRSFVGNNEINAVMVGDDFGQAMEAMFHRDVAASKPVTLQQWQARPWLQRAKEGLARLLESWW
nr:phospholipase D-like domain-containing protein [uncultured Roseateles sp.]